jgi:hypothetical protein
MISSGLDPTRRLVQSGAGGEAGLASPAIMASRRKCRVALPARSNSRLVDMSVAETASREAGQDFIRDIVRADVESGRARSVVTRFPPEPNGYLHIGHAKSIGLNFGIAEEFGGRCHLRFDDTNPTKEEQEYIEAIERYVRWLGFDWGKDLYHASDYFEQLYQWAEFLIRAGQAYVDDQSQHEMRAARGTLTEPGRNSPFRDRSVEENLDLFRRMRAGEFRNGARVLRAKIDMASGNINLRDPVLYRILTRSRALPTRFARWNSKIIGRFTTGFWKIFQFRRIRISTNSRGLTSLIRSFQSGCSPNWCAADLSAAGTIRACRRSPGCAAAACRRPQSVTS